MGAAPPLHRFPSQQLNLHVPPAASHAFSEDELAASQIALVEQVLAYDLISKMEALYSIVDLLHRSALEPQSVSFLFLSQSSMLDELEQV